MHCFSGEILQDIGSTEKKLSTDHENPCKTERNVVDSECNFGKSKVKLNYERSLWWKKRLWRY